MKKAVSYHRYDCKQALEHVAKEKEELLKKQICSWLWHCNYLVGVFTCRSFDLFIEQLFNLEVTCGTSLKPREDVPLSLTRSKLLFLTVPAAEVVFPGTILVRLIGVME